MSSYSVAAIVVAAVAVAVAVFVALFHPQQQQPRPLMTNGLDGVWGLVPWWVLEGWAAEHLVVQMLYCFANYVAVDWRS